MAIASEFTLNIDDNTPKEASSLVNTLSQTFAYSEVDIDSLATWIVYMIGCGEERSFCMNHIKKIFKILRSYYNPSNTENLVRERKKELTLTKSIFNILNNF